MTPGESSFDRLRQVRADGSEFWSARELAQHLEYETWRNFAAAIDRAVLAARNSKTDVTSHVAGVSKVVARPQGGSLTVDDYELSRFGAYLVVMNGDPRKPAIAAAQAYFAIRTREAEVAPARPELTGQALLAAAVLEAQALLAAKDAEIEARDGQIQLMAPKAEYVDTFVATEDLVLLRVLANQLNIAEGVLRNLLIEHKWIYKVTGTRWSSSKKRLVTVTQYRAYADKMEYFRLGPEHEAPRVNGQPQQTLYVTPLGSVAVNRAVRRWTAETDLLGVSA
ncbi:hypothetical protein A6I91_02015 [Prescottella equi]|nr:hypothetical protein A6I91_02015 [Prescottella equi]